MRTWVSFVLAIRLLFWTAGVLAHEEAHQGHASTQTVTGEVVDLACYLAEGARGSGHKECAKKCIAAGLPVGIKTDGEIYLVVGSEHDPANGKLASLAAKRVTAVGEISQRDNLRLLAIEKITVQE